MPPWLYWNECCFRSLLAVAGAIGYAPIPRRSVAHNALTDAIYQAEQVCERSAAPDLPAPRIIVRRAMTKSPIKWAGGKTRVMPQLLATAESRLFNRAVRWQRYRVYEHGIPPLHPSAIAIAR